MNEQQAEAMIALLTSIDQKLELMIGALLTAAQEQETPPDPVVTSWDDVPGPSGVEMRGG